MALWDYVIGVRIHRGYTYPKPMGLINFTILCLTMLRGCGRGRTFHTPKRGRQVVRIFPKLLWCLLVFERSVSVQSITQLLTVRSRYEMFSQDYYTNYKYIYTFFKE